MLLRKKPKLLLKNIAGTDKLARAMTGVKFKKGHKACADSLLNKRNLAEKYLFYIHVELSRFILDAIEDEDKHKYYNFWLFDKIIARQNKWPDSDRAVIKLFVNYKEIYSLLDKRSEAKTSEIFQIPDIKSYLKINFYDDIYYLNKECWEELLENLFVMEFLRLLIKNSHQLSEKLSKLINTINKLKVSAGKAGYNLLKLQEDISA